MSAPSWDNFWRNTGKKSEMPCFGIQTEVLKAYWKQQFNNLNLPPHAQIIDIAAGDGTLINDLINHLAEFEQQDPPAFYATDYSASACLEAVNRNQLIHSICCDSAKLPFAANTFDVIISQYGIEYSGEEAFLSALNTLKENGTFISVNHIQGGSIYQECKLNYQATEAFLATGILAQAKEVFNVGDKVLSHQLDKRAFVEVDRKFSSKVTLCKAVFEKYGVDAGGGYLYKTYVELGQMFNQLQSYVAEEVIRWLGNTQREMQAYSLRMRSMTNSALSKDDVESIQKTVISHFRASGDFDWSIQVLEGESSAQQPLATPVEEDCNSIGWAVRITKRKV